MKLKLLISGLVCLAFSLTADVHAAGETNQSDITPERIGVYDSRAVAYAHFWSEPRQRRINEMIKNAKEAKSAGDTKRADELGAALKNEQEKSHLQVFSTAPVDDVLAEMKESLPKIQKKAGVTRLVSKWDEKTLGELKRAEQVDVTDLLLSEFKLDEKQLKTVASIKSGKPLPLKKAEELMKEGKL